MSPRQLASILRLTAEQLDKTEEHKLFVYNCRVSEDIPSMVLDQYPGKSLVIQTGAQEVEFEFRFKIYR